MSISSGAIPRAPAPIIMATCCRHSGCPPLSPARHPRERTWPAVTDPRSRETVCECRLRVLFVLNVFRQDDDRRPVGRHRHPDASVQQHLSGSGRFLREACHVREHTVQIKFLLVAGSADGRLGLPQIARTGA